MRVREMARKSLCAPESAFAAVARMLADCTRAVVVVLPLTAFLRSFCSSYFDTLRAPISAGALGDCTRGAFEFAQLRCKPPWKAFPSPSLIDLLQFVVARVTPDVMHQLHCLSVGHRGLS